MILFLVACNEGGETLSARKAPPVGAIGKLWVRSTSLGGNLTAQSIDLTNTGNIEIKGITRSVWIYPNIGKPYQKTYRGDCVVSSSGSIQSSQYGITYDTTLVSGDPDVCKSVAPKLGVSHFTTDKVNHDILTFGAVIFK